MLNLCKDCECEPCAFTYTGLFTTHDQIRVVLCHIWQKPGQRWDLPVTIGEWLTPQSATLIAVTQNTRLLLSKQGICLKLRQKGLQSRVATLTPRPTS